MKQIILDKTGPETIRVEDVSKKTWIRASSNNGSDKWMLVYEIDKGWILRDMEGFGATGHHKSRKACMEGAATSGYKFYTVD